MAKRTEQQRWEELRELVKARWSRLGDEDIDNVRGNIDRLVSTLQARYGYSESFAERQILEWSRSLLTEGAAAQPPRATASLRPD